MKLVIIKKMLVFQFFEVYRYDLLWIHALAYQVVRIQFEKGRFAAPSNAGDHLYQILVAPSVKLFYVCWTSDHGFLQTSQFIEKYIRI